MGKFWALNRLKYTAAVPYSMTKGPSQCIKTAIILNKRLDVRAIIFTKLFVKYTVTKSAKGEDLGQLYPYLSAGFLRVRKKNLFKKKLTAYKTVFI